MLMYMNKRLEGLVLESFVMWKYFFEIGKMSFKNILKKYLNFIYNFSVVWYFYFKFTIFCMPFIIRFIYFSLY